MPNNRRSRIITQGVARSPNRAMLRAVGFGDGDFDKPIVGVANGHSTMNPCNAGIQPLVDRAMAALTAAGAKPQVFGVPTVTDGIGMGTEAMKYSLVSREVIADAIETSVNGQAMDGVLVVGWRWRASTCPASSSTPVRSNRVTGRARSSPSSARSRPSERTAPARWPRKISRASRKTPARRSAPAAVNTRRTRCRRRSRRWA